jgi:hypothetical protein
MFIKSFFMNVVEEDSGNLTVNYLEVFPSAEIENPRSKPSLGSEQFGIEMNLESAPLGLICRHTVCFPPRFRSVGQRNTEMNP